jgi:hypothetical protein
MVVKVLRIILLVFMLTAPVIAAEHHHEDGDAHEDCTICGFSQALLGADITEPFDVVEAPVTARYAAGFSQDVHDQLSPALTCTRGPPLTPL